MGRTFASVELYSFCKKDPPSSLVFTDLLEKRNWWRRIAAFVICFRLLSDTAGWLACHNLLMR